MCLINLICLMLLDWAFFRCLINLDNHFLSIWVHFLSFDPWMKSKGMHITNSLLASSNSYVSSLNSFGCLAWMVALVSWYSSITHWIKNFLLFDFEQTALMGPRGASNRYIFNRRPAEHCCGQIWHGVVKQEDTYSYIISTGARKLELTTL